MLMMFDIIPSLTPCGYFPVPPLDSQVDTRAEMLTVMGDVEKHHHEVAPSQSELGVKFGTMVQAGAPPFGSRRGTRSPMPSRATG